MVRQPLRSSPRWDAGKPNMGFTSWTSERPRKTDIDIAKDYLTYAKLQYDRFASGRSALTALVEKHFDEAEGEVIKLDNQRPTAPEPKSKTRSGTNKRPARKKR